MVSMRLVRSISLTIILLSSWAVPSLFAQETDKDDPLDYLDENGDQQTISNPKEEYFFNRIHTAKLEGSTEATVYWINLYIGQPPQRQTAIIDTGSTRLAFPCSECKNNCGEHIDKQYTLKESLTAKLLPCDGEFKKFKCNSCDLQQNACSWNVHYAEGSSISGFIATDYIVFGDEMQSYLEEQADIDKKLEQGSEESDDERLETEEYQKFMIHEGVKLPFGCTTRETNLFLTQRPDGIIGLGPLSNQNNQPPNIIDQIFEKHKENDEQLVFSLCLNWKEGGYMSIGGYNHELHLPNSQTKIIPYSPGEGFFKVNILSVNVDNQIITTSIQNPIIDSGTTLVYGPASFINPLIKELNNQCNQNQQKYKCGGTKNYFSSDQRSFQYLQSEEFPTEKAFFDSFPVFNFEFQGGAIIEWKAHGYLYPNFQKQQGLFTLAFEAYQSSRVYLGGPFIKNYDVLFDKQNKNVHFTPSECSLPNINSVLMNLHSHKIRKTLKDAEFIEQLENFRKHHNITFPSTKGDGPAPEGPKEKPEELEKKNPGQRTSQKSPDSSLFYFISVSVFVVLLILILWWRKQLLKRTHGSLEPVQLSEEASSQEIPETNLKQTNQHSVQSFQQQSELQSQQMRPSENQLDQKESQKPTTIVVDIPLNLENHGDV